MEWQFSLILILGSLFLILLSGMPIAFGFLMLNLLGAFYFFGGVAGLHQLTLSIYTSLATFVLLPIPFFVLMGELMFQSRIGPQMVDTLDKWVGRIPGRLSLLAVGTGTLFACLCGSSMTSAAMLTTSLAPDMEKRGYKKSMILGPIMASGGLAILIPPSGLAIVLGAVGMISIGKLLVGIILPGLVAATLFIVYIVIRSKVQPAVAPPYVTTPSPLSEKLLLSVKNILPISLIVFLVVGLIFVGIATPTEAAATGALGCAILAAAHKRLNWRMFKKSVAETMRISTMVLLIVSAATSFSQILAMSGASKGLMDFTTNLNLPPVLIIIGMQFVVLLLGCFIDAVGIIMICAPIFIPIAESLGFDLTWFGVVLLLNLEMAEITPPFGLTMFVVKSLSPTDTTMGDIYRAGIPFFLLDVIVMALLFLVPQIVLWLPNLMASSR